jgi:hypothetical protein
MSLHTTEATPLPEYRLAVRFNNGVAGEVNLADELSGEVFESLRDPALFATAYQHPAMRTVAWANGVDLALRRFITVAPAPTPEIAVPVEKWCRY